MQLDIVGDGLKAVEAAARHDYDVIFMDMNMPEMDGLDATRRIRAQGKARGGALATIPIIAFTANAFAEDIAACYEAGMNRFVSKPVNKEALLSELLDVLPAAMPAPVAGREEWRAETLDHAASGG